MEKIFVARQPIFDNDKNTFAYELLFRAGLENAFPDIEGNVATSKLLSNTFFSMGINEITGGRPAFINFTEDLILDDMPFVFPVQNIVVEILENIEPSDAVSGKIETLKDKGYTIALDDFVYDSKYDAMIGCSDIIKFDLIETPLDTLVDIMKDLKKRFPNLKFLAEKVETNEEYEKSKEMGFSYFQGYFFSRPEIIMRKEIPSNKVFLLNLISEVNKKDTEFTRIAGIIKNDVSISYKLLKFINSAYFNRPNEVNTIKDALTFLGVDEIKRFLNVIAASGLSDDKPGELVRSAIIRARMCELLGGVFKAGFSPEELFTLGLFSLMDVMLDKKMTDIVSDLGLSMRIRSALLMENKAFNVIIEIVRAFEKADWIGLDNMFKDRPKLYAKLSSFYFDSINMAESLIS